MTETIISLRPEMLNRLEFDHEFFDNVDDYKLPIEEQEGILESYILTRDKELRDQLVLGFLWVAKDFVCRFRAHFPSTIPMTDDLCSVGMEALVDFFEDKKSKLASPVDVELVFNRIRQFIHSRMRDYINDNRSMFSACTRTNRYREQAGEPTEYNFTAELSEELTGMEVNDPLIVDILDTIEAMNDIDAEEMRDLVLGFLEQNHNISEEELTDDERRSLEKLTELVRNAGL